MIRYVIVFCLYSFIVFASNAQSMSYTPYQGKVYKYPNSRKYIKYEEDHADKYELLKEIVWDSIHVTQRETELGFPDVDRDGAFGIMFTTELTVDETSMYRFAITSDDGSIVWIDGELIIDNDYSKGMHMKADTLALRAGTHDVKIWYYQAYPTMFGVIFDSEPVPDAELYFDTDTISINQDLLFDSGRSALHIDSHYLLDSISSILYSYTAANVKIVGHTDNVGSEEYNLVLSQNRADAIRDYILNRVDHRGVIFTTTGMGETQPISNNDTEIGRAQNRRVELLIEGN